MPRVGLSGCGAIGAVHARNLARRGVELAFHNRTPARAATFARRFGGVTCATYDDLLAGCDAVVVATPPERHAEQVLAALAAGKPVLVEKPLCPTAPELARIEAAAAAAPPGAFVMVAENYYYKPSLARMREVIARDGIGVVHGLDVQKLTRQVAPGWKAAHGALLEGGIHFVALAADLVDAALGAAAAPAPVRAPERVTARFPTAAPGVPERQAHVTLAYRGGLEARLHYAWDVLSLARGTFQHSRVDGDAGRILFESNGLYVHVRGPARGGLTVPGLADLMGYGAMTDDFLRCVAAPGLGPYSNLVRARRDLDIVFAAYRGLT